MAGRIGLLTVASYVTAVIAPPFALLMSGVLAWMNETKAAGRVLIVALLSLMAWMALTGVLFTTTEP
jgi:hypothetical protein